MKSFSNISHPDLRIMLSGLKLLKIVMLFGPSISSEMQLTEFFESVNGDSRDISKTQERIELLVRAIETELPDKPAENH